MKQGWEIKKLGECFEYIKNGANIKQERGAGGIPITRIETLSGGVFNRDRLGYADIETIDKYQSYVMESGDLLLSHINSKSYIGRVVVYVKEGNETIIHGMNLLRLKVISDVISPFYMYYYSQTHKFKSQIANRRKDAVNQSSISVTDLKTIDVPVPPREEQERIVEELDCLSGVIEKKREQLKQLDALAQSIFYQMFGDPITNEKGWKIKTIGDVCKLKSGDSSANNTSEGSLPYIKVGDMNMSENVPYITTSSTLVSREENIKGIFPIGTTIFPKRGGAIFTNKKRLTTVEICCDLNTMGVIPMHEVLPLYIFHFFIQIDFGELCNGAAIPQINNIDIAPLKICVPPLTLQQEFADKIEAIEKQKELIKQSITQTEELFNSRMSYYFN